MIFCYCIFFILKFFISILLFCVITMTLMMHTLYYLSKYYIIKMDDLGSFYIYGDSVLMLVKYRDFCCLHVI
ncbi:hypothetical protein I7I53_01066 [Histoplasma capsulatum var. duboisii H88]|uniref:Uncharacterized protein n=1 Tax=Ajellomyces capsulatus (strain H88) TaxID=544711 RepID=A0A8A1LJT8_AJEC8|nr:hypothetical protein I7I53_01066 [Histoplasma capsulatum var. duboisii H88]